MTTSEYLLPLEQQALETLTTLNQYFKWPTIPESQFVSKYLPILTYNFTRPDSEHLKVKTEIWVREVATNPFYTVNVVSDNDPSTILFWVPPLLRSGAIFRQTAAKDSFLEVMRTADLKGKVMPRARDVHLLDALDQRLQSNVELTDDQRQWYYILAYYGVHEFGGEALALDAPSTDTKKDDTITFGAVDDF